MLITILHALTVTYASISVYCMLPCTGQFLTELYNYTLIMLITFHIAACYGNYFITFVTHSTFCSSHYVIETKRSWKMVVRYSKYLNMVDDVNWDICFLCQDSVSFFTLVHQHFLLLFLTYILRTEKHFDISLMFLTQLFDLLCSNLV